MIQGHTVVTILDSIMQEYGPRSTLETLAEILSKWPEQRPAKSAIERYSDECLNRDANRIRSCAETLETLV